jgi:hypothetical protein
VKVTANREYIVATFLQMLDRITSEFCQMEWSFLSTEAIDEVFLLSDNPLVLTDIGEGPAQPLGIKNPNIQVTMPLSPTTVAVARWDGPSGYGVIKTERISTINQRTIDQAHRFVYASYRSEDLLKQVAGSQGKQARTRVVKVKQGKATIMIPIFSD